MAEPTSPADETPARRRVVDDSELLSPPTEEELAASGEPTLEEIRAAAAGDAAPSRTAETPRTAEARTAEPRTAEPRTDDAPPETKAVPVGERTAAIPAAETAPAAATGAHAAAQTRPAPPAEPQPVLAPAEELAPPPPRARGNRVVGTAWVLLAAGLFQVVFFGINALVAFTFGGPDAALPQIQQIAGTPLAWLPVLLFFLLYELTVLLINRAGRVAYVLASLIVGIVVYIASTLLFSLIERHALGDSNTLAQTFLNWEFILIGLAAREVMLWTGLAVGSRGIRLRRRHKEERARYDEGLADA
jgi:hypothetical protein